MITWIASYPKSGNTWVRAFLCSYFSTLNKKFDFNILENIPTFPHHLEIAFLRKKYKNFDFNDLASHWNEFQNVLINKKIKILKTHNALLNYNGYDFTNLNNTIGVIYIVRDPRDVLISYSNHQNISYDDMFLKMKDNNNFEKTNDYKDRTLLSSWKNHFNSWKSFPKNYLLIRYEDLSSDPLKYFSKIIKHLNQIYGFKIDQKKIQKSIEEVKFENLKKIELEKTFYENPKQNINRGKNFFRQGKVKQWKENLKEELINNIIREFSKEMKENNYI